MSAGDILKCNSRGVFLSDEHKLSIPVTVEVAASTVTGIPLALGILDGCTLPCHK
jgi:hypothetical protein